MKFLIIAIAFFSFASPVFAYDPYSDTRVDFEFYNAIYSPCSNNSAIENNDITGNPLCDGIASGGADFYDISWQNGGIPGMSYFFASTTDFFSNPILTAKEYFNIVIKGYTANYASGTVPYRVYRIEDIAASPAGTGCNASFSSVKMYLESAEVGTTSLREVLSGGYFLSVDAVNIDSLSFSGNEKGFLIDHSSTAYSGWTCVNSIGGYALYDGTLDTEDDWLIENFTVHFLDGFQAGDPIFTQPVFGDDNFAISSSTCQGYSYNIGLAGFDFDIGQATCRVISIAFVPSSDSFEFVGEKKDELLTQFPFSYAAEINAIASSSSMSTTTFGIVSLPVPGGATATISILSTTTMGMFFPTSAINVMQLVITYALWIAIAMTIYRQIFTKKNLI